MNELHKPKTLITLSSFILLLVITVLIGSVLWQQNVKSADDAQPASQQNRQILENITPEEANKLIREHAENQDFVILDVRTVKEFQAGHLEYAVHLDFYSKTFRDELQKLDKDAIYLVYCHSGGRSNSTLKLMKEFDFTHAYNMKNGIMGWHGKNFPLVK